MTEFKRRSLLGGAAAAVLLAGCGGPKPPGTLTVTATGGSNVNPGPDGQYRPLTLTVIQMRGASAFDSADIYALQDPATALGGDFIKADQITLVPDTPVSKAIGVEAGAAVIGIVAGYREPAGKTVRAKAAAPTSGDAALDVTVTPSGISVAPA
jgi:type VI secretion system VasD/TssJ family lipoprotein